MEGVGVNKDPDWNARFERFRQYAREAESGRRYHYRLTPWHKRWMYWNLGDLWRWATTGKGKYTD